ncbi:MAG: DUF6351 family protein, partial [Pontibacterium sp.]
MLRLFCYLCLSYVLGACSVVIHKPIEPMPVAESLPLKVGEFGPRDLHPNHQIPFACTTKAMGLGDPVVDNQDGRGMPIEQRSFFGKTVVGYSEYCGVPMQVTYYYLSENETFERLPSGKLPDDIQYIDHPSAKVPFIVRLERGVINRYVYASTMLAPAKDVPSAPDTSLWNGRLIYLFHGGIGIGRHQSGEAGIVTVGETTIERTGQDNLFNINLLKSGYALTASSGTTTDTTFNLPGLARTAKMVKEQFVGRYGTPELTIGFGGSGGSIQQFYNNRHQPELLDGLVVSHLFPDFVSQVNGVGDCELLSYYFDRQKADDDFWYTWENRKLIEGFNSIKGYPSVVSLDGKGTALLAKAEPGSSVCYERWRLAVPLLFNPHFFMPVSGQYSALLDADHKQLKNAKWTHWDDAAELYGKDEQGYALRTYDNVGVQYGLVALKAGKLDIERFLSLNARIGGWLPPAQMKPYEPNNFPYYPFDVFALENSFSGVVRANAHLIGTKEFVNGLRGALPILAESRADSDKPVDKVIRALNRSLGIKGDPSIWSEQSATAFYNDDIAPRAAASEEALHRVYTKGAIFNGELTVPTLALLPYREAKLDLHDARQPFILRHKLEEANKTAPEQL